MAAAPRPPTRRVLHRVGAVALAVALAGAATAGAVADRRVDVAQEHLLLVELIGSVHRLVDVAATEIIAVATAALDDPTSARIPDLPEVDARMVVAAEVVDRLAALRDHPDVGGIAARLLTTFEDLPADRAMAPVDPLDTADQAIVVLEAAAGADAQLQALVRAVEHTLLPHVAGRDVLDVRFERVPRAATWTAGFFDPDDDYLVDGLAGWFGPQTAPLPSPFVQADPLPDELPDLWGAISARVATARALLAFDGWVRGWPTHAGADEPAPPAVVAAEAASLAEDLHGIVADAVEAVHDDALAARRTAGLARAAAWTATALLALAVALLVVQAVRRHRGRAEGWRDAALTDRLTGVANRAGLHDHVDRLAGADRDGHALLLFDLDHFKRINDEHGHAVGDLALRAVAGRAVETAAGMPGTAVAARLGGDEFVILAHDLEDPGHAGGVAAAEIVAAIRGSIVQAGGRPVPLAASVGVAAGVGPIDLAALLDRADQALYEVKRGGRGGHRLHGSATA